MPDNGESNFEMAPSVITQQTSAPTNTEVTSHIVDAENALQSIPTPSAKENDLGGEVEDPTLSIAPENNPIQEKLSEKIAEAESAESAAKITMEHFEHMLRSSGCTEEEIKELLGSAEPAVPSMEQVAIPEDESEPEPAELSEEQQHKKTFLDILHKQLKKLGTPKEIEDHLNRLGFNIGQKMGDGVAKFVERNADFGEFIRYLGTNEYFGKVAHDLGYKREEELEKEGYTAVGPGEIEAYTGLNKHNELTLIIAGFQEAQLCSPDDAQRYLTKAPKEVYESTEFKLMMVRLTEGDMYHTKFSEKVAFLASHGVTKARLSDEGFTHMLMIPERGKISEKTQSKKEATRPVQPETPPAVEPQP